MKGAYHGFDASGNFEDNSLFGGTQFWGHDGLVFTSLGIAGALLQTFQDMLQRVAANASVDVEGMISAFKKRVMGLMAVPSTPGDADTPPEHTGADEGHPNSVTVETFKALVQSLQAQVAAIQAMPEQAMPLLFL